MSSTGSAVRAYFIIEKQGEGIDYAWLPKKHSLKEVSAGKQ
ncbi:hypothetical protein [Evansella clarkii]|nr:hypothetical protein [Evansella clarkii]